jgi:hypothetical protein
MRAEAVRKGGRSDTAELFLKLVNNHPALRLPDRLNVPDALRAEEHYAAGLRKFWEHKYPDAEKEFVQSIVNYDQDARYFYYLGLARLGQNKWAEASAAFEQGARLEQQGRPGRNAVNTALERIQGKARHFLNDRREELESTSKPVPK